MNGATGPSPLVDLHCHLDLYPDFPGAVAQCERLRAYTVAVTTTPKAWPRNHATAAKTHFVRAALGLHPQLVGERVREIDLWESYLPEATFVGEVGLDAGPQYYASFDQQKVIFERILRCCVDAGRKVLTIHSARASSHVLDLLSRYLPGSDCAAVLHWFTGTNADARRAIALGCYFSVNPAMLATDRGRALVASLPADRVLTETDGPFVQVENRSVSVTDLAAIVSKLAAARRATAQDMSDAIRTNLRTLLVRAGHEDAALFAQ